MKAYERFGYVKVAAATPDICVADCDYNKTKIMEKIEEFVRDDIRIGVFPELCVTASTCGDLFYQNILIGKSEEAVGDIRNCTEGKNILVAVGAPVYAEGKLFNAAVVIFDGQILGIVPEKNTKAPFFAGTEDITYIDYCGEEVPFGINQVFSCDMGKNRLTTGVVVGEDIKSPLSPAVNHAILGANVILVLSAQNALVGMEEYERMQMLGQSASLLCGCVFSQAGEGESTTDFVYGAHNMICENGVMKKEAEMFKNETVYGFLDIDKLNIERRKNNTFPSGNIDNKMLYVENTYEFLDACAEKEYSLDGFDLVIDNAPFIPDDEEKRKKQCEKILLMQSVALKKRLIHTRAKSAVVGISGGLDSTLALLVCCSAFDMAGLDRKNIIAVTMPGFGTTDRTYTNAIKMIEKLGATFKEISIKEAVIRHFEDIGHDINVHDVTYENSQARQRTLLLMDLANEYNGMVIGTGDMSELALGWATYSGDHMSMYGVNGSIPKTLVRHIVRCYAQICNDAQLESVLTDVLDTPVSPELLPPKDGEIAQKTEDLVGPYELHDFYLYHILRYGYEPEKIYYMALKAFENIYDKETILKWLKTFYRRFFTQQFKRSCLPDGPCVGSVGMSPREGLKMPSDACMELWVKEIDSIMQV